jgi:hypothetical protein
MIAIPSHSSTSLQHIQADCMVQFHGRNDQGPPFLRQGAAFGLRGMRTRPNPFCPFTIHHSLFSPRPLRPYPRASFSRGNTDHDGEACGTAPPSVLPDISPTRGEISPHGGLRQSPRARTRVERKRRRSGRRNLPPCGGDVRQDRGGRNGAPGRPV